MPASSENMGRAGEFFAASILESHGIRTSHVDMWGTDLWAETPSGRMLRVQVKTASAPYVARGKYPRYQYNNRTRDQGRDTDVYIFVAMDLMLLLVKGPEEVNKTPVIYPKQFTPEAMVESIEKFFF